MSRNDGSEDNVIDNINSSSANISISSTKIEHINVPIQDMKVQNGRYRYFIKCFQAFAMPIM